MPDIDPSGGAAMSAEDTEMTANPLLNCPECGLPAEIVDRFTLDGSPTPVEHIKLVCIAGHWLTPPIDSIPKSTFEPRTGPADPPARRTHARGASSRPRHPLHQIKKIWDELDNAQRRKLLGGADLLH